jgi:hypothetical protein
MKKIIFLLILVLLVFSVVIHGERVAVLPEIMKPVTLAVDDTQFYVTEGASIYIYSLQEFKMLKKFGREGQGPQEFQIHPRVPLVVDVMTDRLIAISIGKISYFTKKGEFIKEVKSSGLVFYPKPFGDQFLAVSEIVHDGIRYGVINIHDSKLNKIKEIYRAKSGFQQPGQGTLVLNKAFMVQSIKGKILLPGKDDATIDVFNNQMKKLFSIHLDQKRIKVDQKFKDQVIHHAKTSPESKDLYPFIKPLIFPDYFPVIAAFFTDEDTIYVMTYKKENSSNEFFTYDINGKFKKQLMIPIQYETELKIYPITIHKEKLYQIVENEEEEEWEFHMSDIK